MKRNYERLPIEKFGRYLITSGDLDPVYIALPNAVEDAAQQSRWLIAYWCFYHCGVASWLSERQGAAFWESMLEAAANASNAPTGGRWPRGSERRHFRGAAAIKAVLALEKRYGEHPEEMVKYISMDHVTRPTETIPYAKIAERVKEHLLFGPWIAFKVADMLERINGVPVNFDQAEVFMFKDPTRAAEMLYRKKARLPDTAKIKTAKIIPEVVDYLTKEFSDLSAPPLRDRPIGLQEVETCLCKWKSMMNGHYPPYNDTNEIRAGLVGWGNTAKAFLHFMPEGKDGATSW